MYLIVKVTVIYVTLFCLNNLKVAAFQTREIPPEKSYSSISKRALQKSHEKSISEKRMNMFLGTTLKFDQVGSLVPLINKITDDYLHECTPVVLYDKFTEESDSLLLELLFRKYSVPIIHGKISDNYLIKNRKLLSTVNTCMGFILFMKDVMRCRSVIGQQSTNKVVIIARSSQWRVYEFLSNEVSQSFVNLLVIVQSDKNLADGQESAYILFTHKLYVDALGSSTHNVLTSWIRGNLTRPHVSLFPNKIEHGFAGHRFIISVASQPPFVIKKGVSENDDTIWDGIEVRLVNLLSEMYNFTTDYKEAKSANLIGSYEAVTNTVKNQQANLGIAGLYITKDRIAVVDVSHLHTQDCAAFISLTSTALPRYRAIMGPFHWSVWLALTMTYMIAILPLAFSDKHTLRHLIEKPEEIENMFWYVFGTFTNCFTFVGKGSWTKATKVTTRLLIGFYWMFTIIITACYTGSIIAFVTLPVYPQTVDTPKQLLDGRYQIGTLDRGGWQYWFENSSDPTTKKLLKNLDLVPTVEEGLKNTTKAFFWSYAFLGSRAQLDYIVRTNFTTTYKRSLLHITSNCFVPYSVGMIYTKNSVYTKPLNMGLLRIVQSGIITKVKRDVEWEMMRSATGKLLAANSATGGLKSLSYEDRALTLDDTQGMFLLLGAGFLLGGASLLSEWFGGCVMICKRSRSGSDSSIASNPRSYDAPTPRQKLQSIQYNSSIYNQRLKSIPDSELPVDRNYDNRNYDNQVQENRHVATVHKDGVDYDKEIDDLFDFAHLFGEENLNPQQSNASNEEIVAECDYNKDKNVL